MSDTKENGEGWTSQDAGAAGWNAKATEQLAGYEQASRERIAGIRADRAEREAKADSVTFLEERDVTDPHAHSQATGDRVQADPEQARDAHAGPELGGGGANEQAQADELDAAGQVEAAEGMDEQAARDEARAAARAEIEAAFGQDAPEQSLDAGLAEDSGYNAAASDFVAQDEPATEESPQRAAARAEIEAAFGQAGHSQELER